MTINSSWERVRLYIVTSLVRIHVSKIPDRSTTAFSLSTFQRPSRRPTKFTTCWNSCFTTSSLSPRVWHWRSYQHVKKGNLAAIFISGAASNIQCSHVTRRSSYTINRFLTKSVLIVQRLRRAASSPMAPPSNPLPNILHPLQKELARTLPVPTPLHRNLRSRQAIVWYLTAHTSTLQTGYSALAEAKLAYTVILLINYL